MKIYTRAMWGARLPSAVMAKQSPPVEAFIHYTDGSGASALKSLAAQEAALRGIQNYHMDSNGWSDIGYHYMVFQPYGHLSRARVFQCRRDIYVPAAQAHHNTRTLAICVHANGSDEIKRNTRYAIEQILRRYPSVKVVGGHRDVVSTDCPGDKLYAQIPTIARAAGKKVYS